MQIRQRPIVWLTKEHYDRDICFHKVNSFAGWRFKMTCPCFIADYVGFCNVSDVLYVPSISELEQLCFTRRFSSCKLFKGDESKDEAMKGKYNKANIDLCLATGRYKEGSKSPINHL
jgi:hypothetical protein